MIYYRGKPRKVTIIVEDENAVIRTIECEPEFLDIGWDYDVTRINEVHVDLHSELRKPQAPGVLRVTEHTCPAVPDEAAIRKDERDRMVREICAVAIVKPGPRGLFSTPVDQHTLGHLAGEAYERQRAIGVLLGAGKPDPEAAERLRAEAEGG